MIIDYDQNPNLTTDEKLRSLKESVQRALDELTGVTSSLSSGGKKSTERLLTLNDVYPVGAIYMSVSNVDPATLFPGTTWTRIKDRFLLSAGDSYSAGGTGGEASHTLTTDEMPSHTHSFVAGGSSLNIGTSTAETTAGFTSASSGGLWGNTNKRRSAINSAGGGGEHNNMPPYLVVNVWKRTA